jgi:hypothetical protein
VKSKSAKKSKRALKALPAPLPETILGKLPREVRNRVYGHLLVAKKPIVVHDGWTGVLKYKSRHDLEPNILAVCRWVYLEGVSVLYGENTFHYLLRDHVAGPPVNVDALAKDDADYNEHGEDTAASQGPEGINIAKFFHLFRHIVIEAESNRHGPDTMESMAKAIRVFLDPPLWKPEKIVKRAQGRSNKRRMADRSNDSIQSHRESNIRTLCIRIHPMRLPSGDSSSTDVAQFTSLDFLEPKSPVIEAVKELLPQFLHVEIMTAQLHPPWAHLVAYVAESRLGRGCRLRLDLRHVRLLGDTGKRALQDPDRDPEQVSYSRRLYGRRLLHWKVQESARRMDRLADLARDRCYLDMPPGGWQDEDDGLWDDFSDDGY